MSVCLEPVGAPGAFYPNRLALRFASDPGFMRQSHPARQTEQPHLPHLPQTSSACLWSSPTVAPDTRPGASSALFPHGIVKALRV